MKNVINIKKYFVRKRLEKVCNCSNRTILYDPINRTLECQECGAILDPYCVIEELATAESLYYSKIESLKEIKSDLEKWLANNRMGQALRTIAQYIRNGQIPCCPHCDKPFNLEDLKTFCSKDYAKWKMQIKEEKK